MKIHIRLDDDVAATLARLRRTRGTSFKDIVNDALRRGLSDLVSEPKQTESFATQVVMLGRLRFSSIDNVGESLAIADSDTVNSNR